MAIIISHVAIINGKGELLILRRASKDKVLPGYWDLPGGTVRRKESPEEGAIRETKEECNLEVSNLKPWICFSNWDNQKQENFVTLIFLSNKYKGKIKLNDKDHEEYVWISKNNLKNKKIVDYLKNVEKMMSRSI